MRLKIAYDGSEFGGWQKQKRSETPTVQGTLEEVLSRLFGEPVRTIGASRTDAGVHALGQTAHFFAPKPLEKYSLLRSLNSMLPRSVLIRGAWLAPEDFHALASSSGKVYRYRIHNQPFHNPFLRHRALHERRPLDLKRLNALSQVILGEHDFASFQTRGTPVATTVRTIHRAEWRLIHPGRLEFWVSGSGFLKQMVRNLVGTMLDLHHSGETPEMMKEILSAQDRQAALGTAPAAGLTLIAVKYPPDLDKRCRKL